jgi:formylglycine-generating enzyme
MEDPFMKVLRYIPFGAALVTCVLGAMAGCGGATEEGGGAKDATKMGDATQKPADAPPATPKCAAGTHFEGTACVADAAPAKNDPAAAPTSVASTTPAPAPAAGPCPSAMALVKGGKYKMGFLKNDATVGDFCFDKTEATAKDYEACVGTKKCNDAFINCAPEATYKKAGKEDHPIVCVDFQQAVDYCAAQGKRLPTDEEWEWAARGGDEGRTYPWGNDTPKDQLCWAGAGARNSTCSVTEHPGGASKDGLLGMAGNVFEWTTNRQDAQTKDRVGRGASWRDGIPNMFRNDRPGRFQVTYRCGFLGIRCATAPQTPK